MGSQRVGHGWVSVSLYTYTHTQCFYLYTLTYDKMYKLGSIREYPNCWHHYWCVLEPLLSKVRVTFWSQALWYWDHWSENQDQSMLSSGVAYAMWAHWTKRWFMSQWEGIRFHQTTHKSMQFKTYKLFLEFSSIFGPRLTTGNWNYGQENHG